MSKPLVLVVDDNAVHLKVCELLLDKFGYLSCCIDSGHEALDIFSATDGFGAVLMDWRMPEIDGIECMQRMREVDDKRGKHTPIIAVTASVMSGDREFCLASGMDDYLSKPFVALELQQVLKRHIGTTSGVTSGLVSALSAALEKNDASGADLASIQIITLMQHIFGADRKAALQSALAVSRILAERGLMKEAQHLENQASVILDP